MVETELDAIDLTDLDRFAGGFPHDVFTALRREAPVWWHPPTEHTPDGEGFWVISRHGDVLEVLRDAVTFSSETGPGRTGGGTILEDLPPGTATGVMINMSDPPEHTKIRGLVNRAFTPRAIDALDAWLRARNRAIVDAALERREVDFLVDVAAELPLQTIAQIMGVSQADRHQLFEWTTVITDYSDRDLAGTSERMAEAAIGMRVYADGLVAEKREHPADDMFSTVVHATAEVDGGAVEAMSADELQAFFSLLFVAGSETTRNAIAGGLLALLEHPDELARLRGDLGLLPAAVEEVLRWTSPTAYNRRTATRDVELHGQTIRAGEKTTHWYSSANRDEDVFDAPFHFDVTRQPNAHLAFGHGLHHCLGAALARREIRIMYEELLPRCAAIETTGPVEWGRSNKHTTIRHLPVRLVPA